MNAEILNFFLNHSKIHPNIAPDGTGYIDATKILELPDTQFFNFGTCVVLFTGEKIDVYCLKGNAKKYASIAIEKSGLKQVVAEIPEFNLPSRYLARNMGFIPTGKRENKWLKKGEEYDIIIYKLERL